MSIPNLAPQFNLGDGCDQVGQCHALSHFLVRIPNLAPQFNLGDGCDQFGQCLVLFSSEYPRNVKLSLEKSC